MQWTNEQKRAIEARDTNILLSAAAGSGKTTVLVGRILALIESGETSIDRMLIVTFTRAAAGEMRERIEKRLSTETDPHLRRQAAHINRAMISTQIGRASCRERV